MEALVFLGQLLGEFLVWIGGDVLGAFLGEAHRDGSLSTRIAEILAFVLVGVTAGFVSLVVFPLHTIADPSVRLVVLLVSPWIVGLLAATTASIRRRKLAPLSFVHGWIVAFLPGIIRFLLAG